MTKYNNFFNNNMLLYTACKGELIMKNLNRIEIIEFTKKYFPNYLGDIRSVSYFDYNNKREYLINNHFIFVIELKETSK